MADHSRVKRIADSFTWPFHGGRTASWTIGVAAVLCLPLGFIPLLGYAIAATRAAAEGAHGPPAWTFSARLFRDGCWTALVLAMTLLPFVVALPPLADALHDGAIGTVVAICALALAWGLLALLVLPHATAAFARSGQPRDLFDFVASLRAVQQDFGTWNVVVAAIVTAWAIGLASVGLLCVGILPGVFYAILVSAHAAAALQRESSRLPAR